MGRPKIDNIGGKIIEELKKDVKGYVHTLTKFAVDQLRSMLEIVVKHSVVLGVKYDRKPLDELLDMLSKAGAKNEFQAEKIQTHLENIFQGEAAIDPIRQSFGELSPVIQDLISFITWRMKGSVDGVHPDFGRLSYLNDATLAPHYHLQADDRVSLLLDLGERLTQI